MWVYRLKGSPWELDPLIPELFARGARGLEEREGEILAYFPAPQDLPYGGVWEAFPDEDWLEAWRRDLKPVEAGPFLVLAPWHSWEGEGIPLVIEPGMAFGTGHHETTRLALAALARHLRPGEKVLDLGTGSGILAIAAARLGGEAVGVDVDGSVLPQAEANARQNGVSVRFLLGSLEEARPLGPFGLVVANLFAELHRDLAPLYPEALAPGGRLLLTGILKEKAPLVREALAGAGLGPLEEAAEGEWVLLAYRR
ncbi:50S ribosomal protein L11 methyltransferase [Thermus thermamylovorans]|uniref:Ribosomal protein L11 methyltransferase n=1 Tax=Thermus thermamylovorans TaxID=2509362 RepID=A0A4Q9B9S9_9DEIN|nr:50S ribosomal protein L11 methyltransferase [Thermus thermamylovorans]TBH21773.1 50S ribosomal protein L11 methyltransferase [Thermus thermamylovorans]